MTSTPGSFRYRLIVLALVLAASAQTAYIVHSRGGSSDTDLVRVPARGDTVHSLVPMLRDFTAQHGNGRDACVAFLAFRSTCPACEKLAASGVHRSRLNHAGIEMTVQWLGGSSDAGRGSFVATHSISNVSMVDESLWQGLGISVVPTMIVLTSAGEYVSEISPWPEHIASVFDDASPIAQDCGS